MELYPGKDLVCLWKWSSEWFQFVSYCEVKEGELSEMRQKYAIADVDGCGS